MELHILAIIITTIVLMALGMLWYSPLLFGKPWMKAMGMDEKDCKKEGMWKYVVSELIVTLAVVVLFNHLLMHLAAGVPIMCAALFVWGFVLLAMISTNIWEKKSWTLVLIGASFRLVAFVVTALIFMSLL